MANNKGLYGKVVEPRTVDIYDFDEREYIIPNGEISDMLLYGVKRPLEVYVLVRVSQGRSKSSILTYGERVTDRKVIDALVGMIDGRADFVEARDPPYDGKKRIRNRIGVKKTEKKVEKPSTPSKVHQLRRKGGKRKKGYGHNRIKESIFDEGDDSAPDDESGDFGGD